VVVGSVLGGCGGGSESTAAPSSHGQPGSTTSSVVHQHHRGNESLPALHAAVLRFLRLIESGHPKKAYRMFSTRCRNEQTFAQFKNEAPSLPPAHGVRIRAYRTDGHGHGAVLYRYPGTSFSGTAWPWVKEGGAWKQDGCPPAG
jgi:hypothetical protein